MFPRFCAAVALLAFCASGQRPVEDEAILQYLNQTATWYRDIASMERTAARQNEALYADNLRESSLQALRAVFQFARASAAFPADKTENEASPDESRSRNLMSAQAKADQRIEQVQARMEEAERDLLKAPSRLRPSLQAMRDKLEGDLRLAKARRDALRNLMGVLTGSDAGLPGKIDDLEHSIPELGAAPKTTADGSRSASAPEEFRAESAGIVGLTAELFNVSRRSNNLDRILSSTDELLAANGRLRAPFRSALQELLRRSDALAQLPETSDTEELTAARKELDRLLARYKLLSAAMAPMGQVRSALNTSRASLLQWRGALGEEYRGVVRYLLVRLGMLGVAVLAVLFLSELWRRGTIRYVQDIRRRRQLLLFRRIAVGCTIAVFVVLSFVTEFGSIATFAGFSAAGVALAMQSVLLSVAAYFFLVGRWGVRVGDRVTVSGVTGDVIDVGLFRLYLMEVAGRGLDVHPTGRIVVFPNAVFFQPSALFKQYPGVDYTWCTLSLTMASDCDHKLVEQRLLGAVESVYGEYREEIERQYHAAQSSMELHAPVPRPEGTLRFTETDVEFVVRCPIQIHRMAEIADRLTRELVAAIEKEPRLKSCARSAPKLQTAAAASGGQS